MIPCEGAKIQQVLLNILRNGAQAMQKNENATPCFVLSLLVEKETQKRVFEPFFTTRPTGVGTGLGLSVSYFIITENHSGTMDVISTPGKGSKFIIRLPLEQTRQKIDQNS